MPTLPAFALAALTLLSPLLGAEARAVEALKVVASFSVIADFAREVGGDRVEVTTLVGPNGDAHVYQPSPADAKALAGADVILVNGLHFEGFLERLVETSGTRAPVVVLTEGVTPIAIKPEFAEVDEHAGIDPHAFQSVPNARIYVRNIADAYCRADASGCAGFRTRAADYTTRLDALDREIRDGIGRLPPERRTVITSHDAFGYFEREYGLTFRAPEGLSTDADPSARDVARLIEEVRARKAAAIFVENITNPRLVDQIGRETGLKIGGALYSDALSDPSGPAATYVDMIRHNLRTITAAVTGG